MVTIENNCFSIPQICESGQCSRLDAVSEEYESFRKEYFDLSAPYSDYIAQIDADDEYLRAVAEFGRGICIIRQDTWEMIITFILSQQNNIPRIKGLIRTLSERYGRRRETPNERAYYEAGKCAAEPGKGETG